jgi:hypothetical protein
MAEPYLERLSQMVAGLEPLQIRGVTLECKHFFSGAALYANGKICASLGPVGFALKLPEHQRRDLISTGKGEEFRFFFNGPVKREYVVLSGSVIQDENELQELVVASVNYVLGSPDSNIVIDNG